ncbi:MAG: response regulator receiver protein [Chitinophagaceae bacterium]|nr:response regulator receiver protein [Chitinophagaceae bacterium]
MTYKSKIFLLADDDPEDQELFKEVILEMLPQSNVQVVANGKEVIEYLTNCDDSELPGLILMDYNMPKGNGAEILDILNLQLRINNIPKIVWSTSGSEDQINDCISKGAKAFFVKPNNFSQLKKMIIQILAFADL